MKGRGGGSGMGKWERLGNEMGRMMMLQRHLKVAYVCWMPGKNSQAKCKSIFESIKNSDAKTKSTMVQ
jgi:hypothetical protein